MLMYTQLYFKCITNKDLLHSTWNSVQCYVAAWMGGEFWEECIHVYVRQNAFWGSPENITTFLMRYSVGAGASGGALYLFQVSKGT